MSIWLEEEIMKELKDFLMSCFKTYQGLATLKNITAC